MDITLKEVRRIIREEIVREYREALSEADPMSNVVPAGPTRREMPGITAASVEKPASSPISKSDRRAISSIVMSSGIQGRYDRVYKLNDDGKLEFENGSDHRLNDTDTGTVDRKIIMKHRRMAGETDPHIPGKKYSITMVFSR